MWGGVRIPAPDDGASLQNSCLATVVSAGRSQSGVRPGICVASPLRQAAARCLRLMRNVLHHHAGKLALVLAMLVVCPESARVQPGTKGARTQPGIHRTEAELVRAA